MITFGFRNKWSGLTRSLIAIAIGLIMVIAPDTAVTTVVWIIAAVLVVSGVASLVMSIAGKGGAGSKGLLGMNSVVDIILGAILFIFPSQVVSILMVLLGIALAGFGLFQIIALASASSIMRLGLFAFILPVICVLGGMLVLFNPFATERTLTIICGVGALVYGVSELISTWNMSRAIHEYEIKFPPKEENSSDSDSPIKYEDIKDADFEKVEDQ